jgi:[ribosomal protein S18]-alanine N-acetyltransferase
VPFTLRPSEPADILAMYQLDLLCFEAPFRFNLESMHYFATRPRSICLIAESAAANGTVAAIAGFVIVNLTLRPRVSSGYVTTLDVHPDFRRRGLARQLMETVETSAIHADVTSLRLHVSAENEPAISFYESIGFTRQLLAENFYAEGLHAWLYMKNLIPHPANRVS